MNSETAKKIKSIILDIEKHLYSNRIDMLCRMIKMRLNKSLDQYYHDLNLSLDKLSAYDDRYQLKLVKRLNKEMKK